MNLTRLGLLALCAFGCAHAPPEARKEKEETAIADTGARCQGGACTCRRVDNYGRTAEGPSDEGAPAAGMKRFELRTGRGLDPVAITVEGRGTLHKQPSSPEPACAYIDLPPGKHQVRLHATANNPEAGMEPSMFVSEYGAGTQSWYDTFQVRCGGDEHGVCSEGHMREWQDKAQATPRGLFDACGSVRIENIKWDGQRAPNTVGNAQLAELDVTLTLEVYKFEPRFPHGAPTCKGPTHEKPNITE
jgi:hypothetical protein